MQYEASLVRAGEPFLSYQSSDQQHLIAWVLSRLENMDDSDTVGIIRDRLNKHAPVRVYTHNPHFG